MAAQRKLLPVCLSIVLTKTADGSYEASKHKCIVTSIGHTALVSKLQGRTRVAAWLVEYLPSMQEAWGSVPSPQSLGMAV